MASARSNDNSVLIVEDEVLVRRALARDFIKEGWEADQASNLEEATVCLREAAPAMVVIDVYLKDEYGLELLSIAERYAPSATLVVITGRSTTQLVVEAMRSGATGVLEKPTTADDILRFVSQTRDASVRNQTLSAVVWRHIHRVLKECGGNKSQAARQLGVSRRGLHAMLLKNPPYTHGAQ